AGLSTRVSAIRPGATPTSTSSWRPATSTRSPARSEAEASGQHTATTRGCGTSRWWTRPTARSTSTPSCSTKRDVASTGHQATASTTGRSAARKGRHRAAARRLHQPRVAGQVPHRLHARRRRRGRRDSALRQVRHPAPRRVPEPQVAARQVAAPYVELHCHSNFSFLDGGSHPAELAMRAAELEMPAAALTDHGGVYGAVRFLQACRKVGVKPLIGSALEVDGEEIILIARNLNGYANLCRLLSFAHADQPKGEARAMLARVAEHRGDLFYLSATDSEPRMRALQEALGREAV